MCSCVVRCSKNANQVAVSHPFDTVMIHSFWKEVNACKCKSAYYHRGMGGKKLLALFVHYYQCAFTSETNPSGLLWVGTLPLWNTSTAPATSETTLVMISRTCIQMQAFVDCALLYHVMLTRSDCCPQLAMLKQGHEQLSKLTDGGDKLFCILSNLFALPVHKL